MIKLRGKISPAQHISGKIIPVQHLSGKLNPFLGEPQMYMLITENGQEFPAVIVEEETQFTATANDIRKDTVAATAAGVTVGTKDIPAYYTTEGVQLIPAGSKFRITSLSDPDYDFTKLQALACLYNTNMNNSVATVAVGVNGNVYPVESATALAEITKDHENKVIDFGVTNTYGTPCIIRYFTYREEY